MNKTVAVSICIIAILYGVLIYKMTSKNQEIIHACDDFLYGQYYTTLSGFYKNQSLLAIRHEDGSEFASFLILPDNGQVTLRCIDVVELEID